MAVVRNITQEAVSLWRPDDNIIGPGKEAEVADEDFVDRAWPTSTWKLIKKPTGKGYKDASVEDAVVFVSTQDESTTSDTEEGA